MLSARKSSSYKAIVSDFDGTLASSGQLSSAVKERIKSYVNRGGVFSIATGRDYYGIIKDLSLELGLKTLHITRGGSEIISTETHQVVWGKYIPRGQSEEVLLFLDQQKDICFMAEKGEKIYTKNGKSYESFGSKIEFDDLDNILFDSIPKIFLPPTKNEFPVAVLKVYEELKEKFPDLHIIKTSSGDRVGIDINDGGAGKHLALLKYAELMKIDPQDIIGVGDSYNDYPLLSACGLKVVMGNSPQELIEMADKIVASQAQDGILEVFDLLDR